MSAQLGDVQVRIEKQQGIGDGVNNTWDQVQSQKTSTRRKTVLALPNMVAGLQSQYLLLNSSRIRSTC